MDEIERRRTNAKANQSLVSRSGRAWPHEELLLRYPGTVFYRSRRDRDRAAGPGGASDGHVQAEEPAAPESDRRRRWTVRRRVQSG